MTRNIGDPRFNPQLRNDGTLFGATGLTGDAFGLFTGTLTFQFGVPTLLAVTLAGTAEGSVVGQSASFDVSHSLYWAGINGVTINGQAVTDFSVSSDSGTDWSRSFVPVPEPSSIALMTVLGQEAGFSSAMIASVWLGERSGKLLTQSIWF